MLNLLRNWFYLLLFLLQLGFFGQPWTRDQSCRFRLYKRCARLLEKVLVACVRFLVRFWRSSQPPFFVVSICFIVAFALWSISGLDSCRVRYKRVRLTVLTTCLISTAPERSFGLVLSTKLSFGFIGWLSFAVAHFWVVRGATDTIRQAFPCLVGLCIFICIRWHNSHFSHQFFAISIVIQKERQQNLAADKMKYAWVNYWST